MYIRLANSSSGFDHARTSVVGRSKVSELGTTGQHRSALQRTICYSFPWLGCAIKADGVPGEISKAEATHVLSYAGIPQVTR